MKHNQKVIRALHLLTKTDAIEAGGHRLDILDHLRINGLAEIYANNNGETVTRITDAGRRALAAASEGSADA